MSDYEKTAAAIARLDGSELTRGCADALQEAEARIDELETAMLVASRHLAQGPVTFSCPVCDSDFNFKRVDPNE